jgi:hypothetical protein
VIFLEYLGVPSGAAVAADGTAHVSVRPALRRAAVWLACTALVVTGASGCKSIAAGLPAAAAASPAKGPARAPADPACPLALEAVSTFGLAVARDALEDKESLDKGEIDLIVRALNEAAGSAGDSGVKQSIIDLVSAYLNLRDSLNGTIDSAIEKRILASTSHLKSECGS